ncbi:PTS mannitol transporter subunit IICB [Cytobacillus gottheilii]|uniref:PTS mannitol transporter subunit IICB n=1 Tax=Cytobacillus gottheilii TaxID=859144 RepID=UPI002494A353|nr:PTS mannitol transporter subunit IICB [Cytobacillus gottheilii]
MRAKIQKFGGFLSGMVMPNIGAFIAWGVLTALFIPNGWFPNEEFAQLKDPMMLYMLPILIAYTGGRLVADARGGVISVIATMGLIVGSDIPMFIGAMVIGPLAALIIKKFDKAIQGKVSSGFEMTVNNFSIGLIGLALALLSYLVIGPTITFVNDLLVTGVNILVENHLLALLPIFTEPARILFLNNAISQGIFHPLGLQDAAEMGKSIFFLLSSNAGPGLGMLLAFYLFGKGATRKSAPSAMIILGLGGIHEIYFPYILMKPKLIVATIVGWMGSNLFYNLFNTGLVAYPSPGSLVTYTIMAPRGEHIPVYIGVLIGAAISFVIASFILKRDKSVETEEDLTRSVERMQELKGKKVTVKNETADHNTAAEKTAAGNKETDAFSVKNQNVGLIVFSCDAGMGSSAMGASVLRKKIEKADLDIEVIHKSVDNIPADQADVVVCHEGLYERAKKNAPNSEFVTITSFLNAPEYDELVERLKELNGK